METPKDKPYDKATRSSSIARADITTPWQPPKVHKLSAHIGTTGKTFQTVSENEINSVQGCYPNIS